MEKNKPTAMTFHNIGVFSVKIYSFLAKKIIVFIGLKILTYEE